MAMCLLALMLFFPAGAEETSRDAAWFGPAIRAEGSMISLLTEMELDVIARLPSEEIHKIVEAMFRGCAGVTEADEIRLWKSFTRAEKEARSAENAAYRAQTLPWLKAAFIPGNRPAEELMEADAETVNLPEWTLEASWTAFAGNARGQEYLAALSALGGTDGPRGMAVTQAVIQRWLAEIDHAGLARTNGHYQFWLYGADTPIDYPVVQCGNNSYYLDRMFNRRSNPAGTLFVDYRNLKDLADPNTLIYGHHMKDGSMFHTLVDYEAEGFFEAHPFMVTVSEKDIHIIEVFAGYVTNSGDHCYDIAISDEEDMRRFVETAEKKSNFDAHVEIHCAADRLVTMSTCAYHFDNARYILIGRLDRVWKAKE